MDKWKRYYKETSRRIWQPELGEAKNRENKIAA